MALQIQQNVSLPLGKPPGTTWRGQTLYKKDFSGVVLKQKAK